MTTTPDPLRQLLRHTIATVAYRGGKTVRGAPPAFASFRAVETARTPLELVAHISDLYAWALSIAQGKQAWSPAKPLDWQAEVDRFFTTMTKFDEYLASDEPLQARGETVPGPHRRLPHARRPTSHAPPHGQHPDPRRKLFRSRHHHRPLRPSAITATPRIRLAATLLRSHRRDETV